VPKNRRSEQPQVEVYSRDRKTLAREIAARTAPVSVIADGGIILSKAVGDKDVLARQILLYRDFVRSVFLGA